MKSTIFILAAAPDHLRSPVLSSSHCSNLILSVSPPRKDGVSSLKGWLHRSRGPRPRTRSPKVSFRPVRAIQPLTSLPLYAAIVARARRAHRFFNERPSPVVDQGNPPARLGLPFSHPAKPRVSFDH